MGSAAKKETTEIDRNQSFSDELEPGTKLLQGQYTIDSYLNSGGFAITYLARDSLDRQVVIKECFPGSFCRRSKLIVQARSRAHQGEFKSIVKMFVQEARSLSKMTHPNIVGVHQVFEDNGTAYMALDLIEGRDLLDTLEDKDSNLQPDQIQTILNQLLDAVAYIHDMNMLHRDISPDNILMTTAMTPILIDFGAAREQASQVGRVMSALRVVKDGYSPQEFYIAGSEQSPSSDLYALGASFYHLIVGSIPPNSQLRLAAMAAREADPYEPLVGKVKGYDETFLSAIDKSLMVMPKDRLQSAREWQDAISENTRAKAAVQAAESEKEIEKTVTNLVSEARKEEIALRDAIVPARVAEATPVAGLSDTASPKTAPPKKADAAPAENSNIPSPRAASTTKTNVRRVASKPKKSKAGLLLASVAAVALIGAVVVTQTDILPFGTTADRVPVALTPVAPLTTVGVLADQPASVASDKTPTAPIVTANSDPVSPVDAPVANQGDASPEIVAAVIPSPVPRPETTDTTVTTFPSVAPEITTELASPATDPATDTSPPLVVLPGDVARIDHDDTVVAALAPETAANDPIEVLTQPYVQSSITVAPETGSPYLTSSRALSLPFVPSEGDVLSVGLVKAGAEPWMKPGQTIVTVNSQPVSEIADIEKILLQSASPDTTEISAWFGVKDANASLINEFSTTLPVVQKTVMANGVEFLTVFENGEWRTKVVADSDQSQGDLNAGDILVAYLSTNERISGRDTIVALLNRELSAGQEQLNFVVQREGSNWFAMLDMSASGQN